jgi:hypothetical protein
MKAPLFLANPTLAVITVCIFTNIAFTEQGQHKDRQSRDG